MFIIRLSEFLAWKCWALSVRLPAPLSQFWAFPIVLPFI
jgi:hypothetical protein